MKLQTHNISKRITAIGLLVVMLCIQAVQSFHTHPRIEDKSFSGNFAIAHVQAFHHCAICDFQFARDTDEPQSNFTVQPLRNIVLIYSPQPQQQLPQQLADFSSRGPPAYILFHS